MDLSRLFLFSAACTNNQQLVWCMVWLSQQALDGDIFCKNNIGVTTYAVPASMK